VRELAPFALLVCACGAAVHEPTPAPRPSPDPVEARTASPEAPDARASFEAMALRAGALAPGMHEASRKESDGQPVELVRADGRDACMRASFEATAPVKAELVDGSGRVLAAVETASATGVLGERGPVCIRKGDVVKGTAEGAARIRWVAWVAP
jgi:hypothetical protein